MKLLYAFLTGLVLGGAAVLVILGETGRLAPAHPSAGRPAIAVSPPGEETHVPVEPAPEQPPGTAPVSPAASPSPAARRAATPVDLRPGTLTIPVRGIRPEQLRDTYDEARGGGTRTHEALDIMAPRGTDVLAATDGIIRKLFLSRAGGITIYQEGPRGEIMYYYAHLERYAPGLREGDTVRRGDVIGYVGTSGNANPDAPHLHFAMFRLPPTKRWWEGDPINPHPLLTR